MECAVCYETCNKPKHLNCGHDFCTSCIKEWFLRSEERGCPMCRRPINFRGLLSSGWLQEREETQESDESFFTDMFEDCIDFFIEDNERFGPPSSRDVYKFMTELKYIQTTIHMMKLYGYPDEYIEDAVINGYWMSSRWKYEDEDPPEKPWFTKYPWI